MMLRTQALMVAFFLAAKAVAASDDANHPEHAAHSPDN